MEIGRFTVFSLYASAVYDSDSNEGTIPDINAKDGPKIQAQVCDGEHHFWLYFQFNDGKIRFLKWERGEGCLQGQNRCKSVECQDLSEEIIVSMKSILRLVDEPF